MAKTKVAILEDDSTLSAALKAAVERAGFEAYISDRPNEITEYLEKNSVSTLFVDCLLPSGSGVDFVDSIRKKFPPAVLDIVMMSGIFTDAGVIKETFHATKAVAFLKKPFGLQDAINCIKVKENSISQEEMSPRKALYLLFNKAKVSVREKRKAIEALEEIHGFDLPYLYSLLVETNAMGHLNVIGQQGKVFGISFSDGKIVKVDFVDEETQLGNLLIEAGFIFPDDLNETIAKPMKKKLGEKLIGENVLSPHAFDIAIENQMTIRLSRTILDMPVKVNFVATDVGLAHPHIESETFAVILHDWIASKIDFEWLKAHYTQWSNYSLRKSTTFADDNSVLRMPLISHFKGLIEFLTNGQPLGKLMEARKYPEDTTYKALHLLLAKGLLIFGDRVVKIDPVERLKSLKNLLVQFHGKNKLEIWDLLVGMAGGSDSEPGFVVAEFRKLIGAAPAADQKELSTVYAQLKKIGDEALHFSQGGNRDKMKEEMARQEVEIKIKAASVFEEAKAALHKSLYAQAAPLLLKASQMDPNLEKMKLYMLWSRLGQAEGAPVKVQVLKDVEMELLQVPTEEKFDALYSFVNGLFNKAKGDLPAAKKAFEKAYNLDNNFIQARREIAAILQKTQKKDVMNRDLKDLVAGFFKKR